MEVILLEQVERLGGIGDTVKVKDGYARNFLLPKGIALRASEENKKYFESERKNIEAANNAKKAEAEKLFNKINGKVVTLIRQASDEGKLYGSVMPRDIANKLDEITKSQDIKKSNIILSQPIREVGVYDLRVRLHAELVASVEFRIARTEDEAKNLKKVDVAEIEAQEAEGHVETEEESDNKESAAK